MDWYAPALPPLCHRDALHRLVFLRCSAPSPSPLAALCGVPLALVPAAPTLAQPPWIPQLGTFPFRAYQRRRAIHYTHARSVNYASCILTSLIYLHRTADNFHSTTHFPSFYLPCLHRHKAIAASALERPASSTLHSRRTDFGPPGEADPRIPSMTFRLMLVTCLVACAYYKGEVFFLKLQGLFGYRTAS